MFGLSPVELFVVAIVAIFLFGRRFRYIMNSRRKVRAFSKANGDEPDLFVNYLIAIVLGVLLGYRLHAGGAVIDR